MATSLSDILTTVQNGVTAANNFTAQLKGTLNNISAKLSTIPASSGFVASIAGNTGAFTLNATTGITNSSNDIQIEQGSTSQFGAVKADGTTVTVSSGVLSAVALSPAPITNSLSSDHLLNNVSSYFDGPTVAQGTVGTWFASGAVMIQDTAGAAQIFCKLWDGTTVIASGGTNDTLVANGAFSVSLSGFITSPAGNLRISCKDISSVNGKILFNLTGSSKDSTITAFRIA